MATTRSRRKADNFDGGHSSSTACREQQKEHRHNSNSNHHNNSQRLYSNSYLNNITVSIIIAGMAMRTCKIIPEGPLKNNMRLSSLVIYRRPQLQQTVTPPQASITRTERRRLRAFANEIWQLRSSTAWKAGITKVLTLQELLCVVVALHEQRSDDHQLDQQHSHINSHFTSAT